MAMAFRRCICRAHFQISALGKQRIEHAMLPLKSVHCPPTTKTGLARAASDVISAIAASPACSPNVDR
jgi:hypothetical protein